MSLIKVVAIVLSCLCLYLKSNQCQAQLLTNIHVIQNSEGVQIVVNMQSKSPVSSIFKLSNAMAQISKMSGFNVVPSADADLTQLQITDFKNAEITYLLKVNLAETQYLTEDLNWYPRTDDQSLQQAFNVQSETQAGFEFVHSATTKNQSGVSAVIGRFIKYTGSSKKINIYLQTADEALASILLTNLENYLTLYQNLLTDYPYDSFSVVEVSDQVGYAFPRMTWIGSKLLRFPFILKTSLPHELLHSWWGNSVFVDYNTGNWCEGLTVYGADYALLSEQEKTTYRQKALIEYMDYVKQNTEISLAEFVSRDEDRSLQAIGYNKSLMMFVMLENMVTKTTLQKVLKEFSLNFKFKQASYKDIFDLLKKQPSLAKKSKQLDQFYSFWILEKGAIDFSNIKASVFLTKNQSYQAVFELTQDQFKSLNNLPLDIDIYYSENRIERHVVQSDLQIKIDLKEKPIGYVLDPDMKLFRKLANDEKPASFSKFFGSASADLIAAPEKKDTLSLVFPNIELTEINISNIDFNKMGIILVENYLGGSALIDNALLQKNVQITADKIVFSATESFLNSDVSYFLTLKVKEKIVIIFRTNASLTDKRWFERWSRYGAQGYVVLNSTAAVKQGLWPSPMLRQFN